MKRILISVLFLILASVICWYVLVFEVYVGQLKHFANRGLGSASRVEHVLYPLAVASEEKSGIRSWAVRKAYAKLVLKNLGRQSTIFSEFNVAFWILSSHLRLSDREVFGLWIDCALYTCDESLDTASKKEFGKELNNLSRPELALLVAMVRNPSTDGPRTERGKSRAKEILENQTVPSKPPTH